MGRIDYGPLTFPVTVADERFLAELTSLGFTDDATNTPPREIGARVHLDVIDGAFRVSIFEADNMPASPTRYGEPVPNGGHFHTVSAAVHSVLSVLGDRVVAHESHCVHLHAATIALGERGVVIPAVSGAGKTTMAAELGRYGRVVTDEMVAIDRGARTLHAPLRPLSIKQSGFARAAARYPTLTPPQPDEFVWHVPLATIGISHQPAVAPSVIVIAVRGTGPTHITEIAPGAAMLAVFEHCYDLDVDPSRAVDDVAWLVANSTCVRLQYEESADAAPLLAAWIDNHAQHPTHAPRRADATNGEYLAVAWGSDEVRWWPATRDLQWVDTA